MPDEISNNDRTGFSEPLPINTTGSLSIITPSLPLESSTTRDTPSLANNDNQGILSEDNLV